MNTRFVTRTIHAYIDYPVALSLVAVPFVLGLGASNPLALWLSVATGVAAFVLTLLTDHETGVFRVLPYWFHLAVDRLRHLCCRPHRAGLYRPGPGLLSGQRGDCADRNVPAERAGADSTACRGRLILGSAEWDRR